MSDPWAAWYGTDQDENRTESYVVDDDGWAVCSVCDSYLYEYEYNYEDTDTESDFDLNTRSEQELQEYLGEGWENVTLDSLKSEYLFAKRRFRRFSKRGPRRHRFPRKSSWSYRFRSHGKGVVGPPSLAGGKGKGKHFRRGAKGRGRGPKEFH
eukprot:8361806-Karenia_brevis.AAC.1